MFIEDVITLIYKVCQINQIDYRIILAIIKVESDFNEWAIRYEPNFSHLHNPDYFANQNNITINTELILQKCSFGLMQIMGATARSIGYEGPLTRLLEPKVNLHYGTAYFFTKYQKYKSIPHAIAAYNSGVAAFDGKKFKNQDYVDKVIKIYKTY